ncbi:MAG: shikimate dehydrogenase [Candidatus Nitrosocosmicus sp.]|nr:shikimate dehydrogenase [Candidatus Nitrosocosmicus sp.]MDN5865815.1 shikimate dehydrogenase [Candidatus Nitrosocosmicus sp.]
MDTSNQKVAADKSSKTFCIIGDPVEHSFSPLMHNAAFKYLNLNYSYIAFKVKVNELKESVESLRDINVAGFNVTIPHKVEITRYIDRLSDEASLAGAVNTVKNENGIFVGYNTDIYGLMAPIEERLPDFECIEILILGAGGSSRAALVGLSRKKNIKSVFVVNRDKQKLSKIIELGNTLGLNCVPMEYADDEKLSQISTRCKLIINTTSVGLANEKSLLSSDSIHSESIVFDIVYKPIMTNLLECARSAHAKVIFGYEMLLNQGYKSFEIWTGLKAPQEVMRKALLGIFGEPR